ncbi:MAG: hypothetical protein QNJ72_25260 [Pleurocapsa sp. MO_226.B13]|nr:hypothetical protein [Pleurocapsa sp. MO_226.B13]
MPRISPTYIDLGRYLRSSMATIIGDENSIKPIDNALLSKEFKWILGSLNFRLRVNEKSDRIKCDRLNSKM